MVFPSRNKMIFLEATYVHISMIMRVQRWGEATFPWKKNQTLTCKGGEGQREDKECEAH